MKTIIFEDQGQDFLEWDVLSDGSIVGCRPFQFLVWKKFNVSNLDSLVVGGLVSVFHVENVLEDMKIKYPVLAINQKLDEVTP